MIQRTLSFVLILSLAAGTTSADPLPPTAANFVSSFCGDCHSGPDAEGELRLDAKEIDWQSHDARKHWERVLNALQQNAMPPADADQPGEKQREQMLNWLDKALTDASPVGGTVFRRLNSDEYRNTVRALFEIPFELPEGFPTDTEAHEFDTVADSLVLSPPLMDAYSQVAAAIADEIFPPPRPAAKSVRRVISPKDLVISYSSGVVLNGTMRLASKCSPTMRSCTWPSKIEITTSGVYRITVDASTFRNHSDEPMLLQILAKDVSGKDSARVESLRQLKQIELKEENVSAVSFDAELYDGQTIVFHYANAPLDSDREDKESLQEWFRAKFQADPRYLAAWQKMTKDDGRGGFRGGLGWQRVKKFMASDDLDTTNATMDSDETKKLLKAIAGNPVLYTETVAYDHFENGPALEIHGAVIEGPMKLIEGPNDIARRKTQEKIFGENADFSDEEAGRQAIADFLSKAFRRPADAQVVDGFFEMFRRHLSDGYSHQQAMHLVIRTALISPRFLYREWSEGSLDNFEIASRLSYFLTSSQPDSKLLADAANGRLLVGDVLLKHAERLRPRKANSDFVRRFTGQWLDLNLLDDIMPDARLKFSAEDQLRAREEVETFFVEMLNKNRPMTDFIAPDFAHTSASIGQKIYGLNSKLFKPKNKALQRVAIDRNGRHGGLLGQAGILMATANGVDTQPVVRGVWVLENILGDPPPPPPKAVPALTPGTAGAKTPRELLKAHASEASCAGCHRKIDPIGFALENFDAVGRWRETYAVWSTNPKGKAISMAGPRIDATGMLPDGTQISDVVDLKKWIVANIDQFSRCVSKKLMTYATGRELSYAERKEIASIVVSNHNNKNGFRDLLLQLINSQSFRQ